MPQSRSYVSCSFMSQNTELEECSPVCAIQRFFDNLNGPAIPPNLWDQFSKRTAAVHEYASDILKEGEEKFGDAAASLSQIKDGFQNVVSNVTVFRLDAEKIVNLDTLSKDVGTALQTMMEELEESFPPPTDAPGHKERQDSVHTVLGAAQDKIVQVAVQHGMNEAEVRVHVERIISEMESLIVITGVYTTVMPVTVCS